MVRGTQRMTTVLVILFMIVSPLSPLIPLTGADLSDPGSLSTHAPFAINGNSDFTTSSAVVAGDGSQADPYVIENWTIDAQTADGIRIQNTDAHFIIRNCRIWNGSNGATNEGIYFNNVVNGTVQDSRVEFNHYSIYMTSSENITIYNNSLNESAVSGLFITGTTNVSVHSNEVFNNTQDGIAVAGSSEDVDIYQNDVHNNSRHGLYLYGGANDNRAFNNTVHNNTWHGIYLSGASYTSIYNNTITNNSRTMATATFGLYLMNSEFNTLADNVLFDNRYNLGVLGLDKNDYNHTIHENNTVEGKPVHYWVDNSSKTVPSDAGFVGLIDSFNITVADMSMSNNQHGVLLFRSNNATIDNITVDTTVHGIYIQTSSNDTISSSKLTNMTYGVYLRGVSDKAILRQSTVNDMDHVLYRQWSVSDGWIYNSVLSNNTMFNINDDAVDVREANYFTFDNNTIRDGSSNGLHLRDSDTLSIWDNEIHDMALDAIAFIGTSIDTVICNNEIHHNTGDAISLDNTNDTYIHDNHLHNNTGHGLHLRSADRTDAIDNRLAFNDRALFLNGSSDNNVFHTNRIYDNTYGIYLSNSDNNRIYNNYFDNTNNYFTFGGSGNEWNTTKTSKYNIATGPYLGGNYWSDYAGSDTDGDWLGDTAVPHGPGDNLPLLIPPDLFKPGIMDDTNGTPTTGDLFPLNASAWDNSAVDNVTVEYWFNGGAHTNSSMNLVSGDELDGEYRLTVNVPNGAMWLTYFMSANDTVDNWNMTGNNILTVLDNDPPLLADNTVGTPTTGDDHEVNVTVSDNINVSIVHIEFWFDTGPVNNTTMDLTGGHYLKDLSVPDDATVLHYNLSATDNSSNWAALDQVDLLVLDDDGPAITDLSGTPTTGENFTITSDVSDNIAVDTVMVEFWFDNGTHTNTTMDHFGDHIRNVTVPNDALDLHYMISANDTTGNLFALPQVDLPVVDNDRPILSDLTGAPSSGVDLLMTCQASDNIGLTKVEVEFWFDDGTHTVRNMLLNGTYERLLAIPIDVQVLSYIIRAIDPSSNQRQVSRTVPVMDIIKPEVLDLISTPTTGDDLPIAAQVSDNWAVASAFFEYWFDAGSHLNVTYSPLLIINVPSDALKLRYIISVNDTSDNHMIVEAERDVVDDDLPTIQDLTGGATTGDELNFDLTYEDNIDIQVTYLEYWFDRGAKTNGTYYGTLIVLVPDMALEVGYRLVVIDTSGNLAQHVGSREVVDNDPPSLADPTGLPETGEPFAITVNATDNTLINEVKLDYVLDDGDTRSFVMTPTGGNYQHVFVVPVDARVLSYTLIAIDMNGNFATIERTVDIKDIISPTITDMTGDPTTGEVLIIDLTISDNIGVVSSKIDHWFDEDPVHQSGQYTLGMSVKIPDDATGFHYAVTVEDAAHNTANISVHIGITDNDLPTIEDITKGSPTANSNFKIKVSAMDNIRVQKVTVEYWSGNDDPKTVNMELKGSSYEVTVPVGNVEDLNYIVHCTDPTGNSVDTDERSISVSGYLASSVLYGLLAIIIIIVVMILVAVGLKRNRRKERVRIRAIQERRAREVELAEAKAAADEEDDEEEGSEDEGTEPEEVVPEERTRPVKATTAGLWEKKSDEEDEEDDEDKDAIDEILDADEDALESDMRECPECNRSIDTGYSFCPYCAYDFEEN